MVAIDIKHNIKQDISERQGSKSLSGRELQGSLNDA
jgi:hypothetical protein